MMTDLELAFHRDMISVYERALKECHYPANVFKRMVSEMGGFVTARRLLAKPDPSDGMMKLKELGRLDLSMEAVVLQPEYQSLFSLEERRVAWERLKAFDYILPEPGAEASPVGEVAFVQALPDEDEAALHTGRATKGSRRHLQELVAQPGYLDCLLMAASPSLRAFAAEHPRWVSPVEPDQYREYQDRHFLKALGLAHLAPALAEFWPSGGPLWDGLAVVEGRNGTPGVILLEAKAHETELKGPGCRAAEASRGRIDGSLATVKQVLGAPVDADWTGAYYQHANRLAHLYFLNVIGRVPTWLVELYFVGDSAMNGPQTVMGWEKSWDELAKTIALPPYHLLAERVISVCAPAGR